MRSIASISICFICAIRCLGQNAELASSVEIKNAVLKPFLTISIASGVAGIIDEVHVLEGDIVDSKSLLLKIRDDEAVLSHRRATLALETAAAKAKRDVDIRMAEKSAEVAEQELGRTLKANSLAPDTYPVNEVERYRLVWERSKIDVERFKLDRELAVIAKRQAEIEVEQTEQIMERHRVRSPMRAMVVAVEKHVGEWVDASTKTLEIMPVDKLRIEGFLAASEAIGIEKGRPVSIVVLINKTPTTITGKVSFVSPIINPANDQVRIFVEVENQDSKLRPGMSVRATISNPQ